MKNILVGSLFVLIGAACMPVTAAPDLATDEQPLLSIPSLEIEEQKEAAPLPDFGPAPELGNETWLNVEQPLRLAELRGKVILLDMWTFG